MSRVCETCKKIENPLSRLRFKKSRLDGKVYCENHMPLTEAVDAVREPEPTPVPSFPRKERPSAGYVVIDCPKCRGGLHECKVCSNYGAVRIDPSYLNVYRPPSIKAPSVLTEG